jgi:uncharacterized protein YdhG (YjbR/CyaY superfamily)
MQNNMKKETKITLSTTATGKESKGITDGERAAMKARTQELMAEARLDKKKTDGEREVLVAIAAMSESDRVLAKRLHTIIKANAPILWPKTWYGMPAYTKNGKIICFFQSAEKFKTRYATFGFQHDANLDEGNMWSVAFALKKLTAVEEARIITLLKKAVN